MVFSDPREASHRTTRTRQVDEQRQSRQQSFPAQAADRCGPGCRCRLHPRPGQLGACCRREACQGRSGLGYGNRHRLCRLRRSGLLGRGHRHLAGRQGDRRREDAHAWRHHRQVRRGDLDSQQQVHRRQWRSGQARRLPALHGSLRLPGNVRGQQRDPGPAARRFPDARSLLRQRLEDGRVDGEDRCDALPSVQDVGRGYRAAGLR
ncbi:hypothetical protein D3C85_1329150 [compost metagenome]